MFVCTHLLWESQGIRSTRPKTITRAELIASLRQELLETQEATGRGAIEVAPTGLVRTQTVPSSKSPRSAASGADLNNPGKIMMAFASETYGEGRFDRDRPFTIFNSSDDVDEEGALPPPERLVSLNGMALGECLGKSAHVAKKTEPWLLRGVVVKTLTEQTVICVQVSVNVRMSG